MPPFNFHAAQLEIIHESSGRTLRVLLEDSLYKKDFTTYIIGISKDSLCFVSTGKGNYDIVLPESNFPQGVATLFLMDQNLKLLSERSVYIKEGSLGVVVHTDKTIYEKREKALLSISITDAANHPVPASICIAVKDSAVEEPLDFKDLICRTLQNEKGIFFINWLLAHSKDLSDDEVDLFMLRTQGVFNHIKDLPAFHSIEYPDSSLLIEGKIISKKGEPLKSKIVTLFSLSSNMIFDTDTTDAWGRFRFPFADYPDYTMLTIQISDIKGKIEDDSINLDKPSIPKWNHFSLNKNQLSIYPSSTIKRYLNFYVDTLAFKGKEYLKPVIVKATRKKELNYDKSKRVSNSSHIISADKIENGGYSTAANLLSTIPGVHMGKSLIIGSPSGSGGEPLLIVDGIEYTSATLQQFATGSGSVLLDFLNTIPSNTIDFIEVLEGPDAASYGGRGSNGVIIVNTKSRLSNMRKTTGLKSFTLRGYHQPPLFTIPDYSNKQIKNAMKFDNRSTLYWNGNLIVDSGKISLNFFTSDIPGIYKVTITGITVLGDFISHTVIFKIK